MALGLKTVEVSTNLLHLADAAGKAQRWYLTLIEEIYIDDWALV